MSRFKALDRIKADLEIRAIDGAIAWACYTQLPRHHPHFWRTYLESLDACLRVNLEAVRHEETQHDDDSTEHIRT